MKSNSAFENIIPACYAETLLMNTLGFLCNKNHQNGDGNVLNVFQRQTNKQLKIIGVMDKSQGTSPSHIQSDFIDKELGPNNLILKKHKTKNHYIIFIDELLEDWIIKVGSSKKIKSPYLSFQSFKDDMKSSKLLSNKKIHRYFNEIERKNPESFRTINNWVKLIEKG